MIRIGVIGAGPNGTGNAKRLAAHADRATIAAVADIDPAAGRKLADAHDARLVSDYTEMLDDVDAVVISTPNDLHPDMAVTCAEAGKHVWIEKPMALSVADADRIVAAVDAAGVASFVGFSVRFGGVIRRMKQAAQDGELGELVSLWSRRLCFMDPATIRPWRLEYARSGGVMSELLCHEIDWIVDIAGDPTGVYCRAASRRHQGPGDNDHLWMTFTFGEETIGTLEGSQMAPIPDYYRGVVGREGSAATRQWGGELWMQKIGEDAVKVDPPEGFDKHGHFLDVIEGRCASVADSRYGRKIVVLSASAIDSAIRGEAVPIELPDGQPPAEKGEA